MMRYGLFVLCWIAWIQLAGAQCNFNAPHQAGESTDASAHNRNIVKDGSGNIIIFGNFHGKAVFQNYSLSSPSSNNMFLAKYDPSGVVLWAKMITNSSLSSAMDIVVDGNDNIYITGFYESTLSFGGISISEFGPNRQVFIAKYSASGTPLWAKSSSGNCGSSACGSDYGHYLSTDEFDNVYLTGSFDYTFSIDSFSFTASNSIGDFFVAKFDGAGTTEWVRVMYGSVVSNFAPSIFATGDGSYFLSGNFTTSIVVGGVTMSNYPAPFDNNSYVAMFSSDSVLQWVKHFKGDHFVRSVVLDGNKDLVISGSFKDTLSVEGDSIFSQFNSALFVGKIDINGNLKMLGKAAATPYGNQLLISTEGLFVDDENNIYLTGWYTGSINFNGMFIADTSDSYYIVKYDSSLNVFWVNSFGVTPFPRMTAVVKLDNCNPIIYGSFYENVEIDTLSLSTATYSNDIFLVEFDDNSGGLYSDTVGTLPTPTVTTSSISGSPFCPSDLIDIPYTVANAFNGGNVFTAELSDSLGDFSTPTNIGSVNGTVSGIIYTVLSANAEPGTGYRIRVTASDPSTSGVDNGLDLVIEDCSIPLGISSRVDLIGELNIHPNPNNGAFVIQLSLAKGIVYDIELTNSIGQKVLEVKRQVSHGEHTRTVDLREHSAGIYQLRVSTEQGMFYKKIVIN